MTILRAQMRGSVEAYAWIVAARVPDSMPEGTFGPWRIWRQRCFSVELLWRMGWTSTTVLTHGTWATRHLGPMDQDVVMEDSLEELRKHLPIWLHARGRVLVTGLGLGCVVRGLLAKPTVEHIDVVEIDETILRVVGAEFEGNPRVTLHHADAETWPLSGHWDYSWHDLWTQEGHGALCVQHARLIARCTPFVTRQGAWAFPRAHKRIWPDQLLGAKRRKSA